MFSPCSPLERCVQMTPEEWRTLLKRERRRLRTFGPSFATLPGRIATKVRRALGTLASPQ